MPAGTIATLTSKGQLTIPVEIRHRLRLQRGDRVEFVVDELGVLRIVPLTCRLQELKGMLPAPGEPVSLEEMEEASRDGACRG